MAERVAFTKSVTLDWLSAAAEFAVAGCSRKAAGDKLNGIIGQSLTNQVNIKQTRIILLKAWFDSEPALRNKALESYHRVSTNEKAAIHWALLMSEYPIFFDLCESIGYMMTFKDTVTLAQIKEQVYTKWGERSTLGISLPKNIKTLRELGALTTHERVGTYQRRQHIIHDHSVVWMLLYATLRSGRQGYLPWEAFVSHPALFPFVIDCVAEADMASLPLIMMDRYNGQTVFRLNGR